MAPTFPPLERGEEVLFEAQPRAAVMYANAIRGFLIGVAGILTLIYLSRLVGDSSWSSAGRGVAYVALAIPGFIAVILLVTPLVALRMVGRAGFRLTNRRVILVGGMGPRQQRLIPLATIWRIQVSRSFTERLFGVGTIRFQAGPNRTDLPSHDAFYALADMKGAMGALRKALAPNRRVELVGDE
jgi:uncharacterized membrane protein YdbT with pleckstrin-like domain